MGLDSDREGNTTKLVLKSRPPVPTIHLYLLDPPTFGLLGTVSICDRTLMCIPYVMRV